MLYIYCVIGFYPFLRSAEVGTSSAADAGSSSGKRPKKKGVTIANSPAVVYETANSNISSLLVFFGFLGVNIIVCR